MFQLGAGAEICPEPEKSKMTGSGNPGLKHILDFVLDQFNFLNLIKMIIYRKVIVTGTGKYL